MIRAKVESEESMTSCGILGICARFAQRIAVDRRKPCKETIESESPIIGTSRRPSGQGQKVEFVDNMDIHAGMHSKSGRAPCILRLDEHAQISLHGEGWWAWDVD